MTDPASRLPMIVLVAPEHAEVLRDEFGRYVRDYELRCTSSAAETSALLREARSTGIPVALVVTESMLPDSDLFAAFAAWRRAVPTARRVVAAHWSRFMTDAEPLRAGLATGKYDAYLLMPRGRARRGVPRRGHRAALRLGLDRGRSRGGQRRDHRPAALGAHHGDPRLPRPDGHAEPAGDA